MTARAIALDIRAKDVGADGLIQPTSVRINGEEVLVLLGDRIQVNQINAGGHPVTVTLTLPVRRLTIEGGDR